MNANNRSWPTVVNILQSDNKIYNLNDLFFFPSNTQFYDVNNKVIYIILPIKKEYLRNTNL